MKLYKFWKYLIFKKIKVLDCEGVDHQKLFEKPKPGYLDFSIDNAKVEIANCLCEKYMKSKDVKYKKEIFSIPDQAELQTDQ